MRRRKDIGTAHQRIDDHERLCRIMQKQTCDMIQELKGEVNGIKKIILIAGAGIISGLFTIVLMLLDK